MSWILEHQILKKNVKSGPIGGTSKSVFVSWLKLMVSFLSCVRIIFIQ